jgi:organic hydroperoxide reductase OsmC/OhrA
MATPVKEDAMHPAREFRYPVSIDWWGAELMNAHAPEKGSLRVAPPREFGGTHPSFWNPEQLLAAAVGSCYAISLRAVAERMRIPLHELEVEAIGRVERSAQGGYGYAGVHLDVALETDSDWVEAAERAAQLAEERCIVAGALAIPVDVRLVVRTRLASEPRPADLVTA